MSELQYTTDARLEPECGSSFFRAVFLALVSLLLMLAIACGGDDSPAEETGAPPAELDDAAEIESLITQQDRVYSVDDFLAVGWKKSKQLETETLDSAIDAWYGFYNRKDIELRFYESHEAALAYGVGPAQETTQRGAGARVGAATVWTVNISLYGAYAVAGNVVMMCELELASCEGLIDALE